MVDDANLSPSGDADRDREEREGRGEPIIRDKRRIDPETGKVRVPPGGNTAAPGQPSGTAAPGQPSHPDAPDDAPLTIEDILGAAAEDLVAEAEAEVPDPSSEHLADLKRVTAEYANYRKRTEANREADRERATATTLLLLLPVLDDIDRAEKHGDLGADTPFATIATKLRAAVERLGLTRFGTVGEPFDPQQHEAIFQQEDPEVTVDTVADVVESGYVLGSVQLRPARVVVRTPR